jgi:ribonuclease Z
MKRALVVVLAVVLTVAAIAYVFRAPLAVRIMERVVARNMRSTLLDEVPDGLQVALCGAGSPMPDPERSGPCVAVIAGNKLYIVDAGAGSARVLARMRLPQGRIEAIFLTHFHSDHIDGLGEMMMQRWVGGRHDSPVPVYGPIGVQDVVVGFKQAYGQDGIYRVRHHGPAIVPPQGGGGVAQPFSVPADGESTVVLQSGGLEVTTFRVDHGPVDPAVGYRFDYGGRSVLISGDAKKSANVQRFAAGVDLLVHEALAPQLLSVATRAAEEAGAANIAQITRDILNYHTTPVEAAEIAREAGVGQLLFYHIVPPLPLRPLQEAFVEGVDEVYQGPVTVGRDGTFFNLPAGSDTIEHEELL